MIQVRRLGHATFDTPDVQRQAEYYAEVIGLRVHRDGNRAMLATGLGEEAVVFKPGSTARLTNIALQVAPDVEPLAIGSALAAHGVKIRAPQRHWL